MQKLYEAPELTLIGRADEVVLGLPGDGLDMAHSALWILNSSRIRVPAEYA